MPKKKCSHCSKKIKGIVIHTCECEKKVLCIKCRLPENHNCDYNFQEKQKKRLEKSLVKVEFEKVISI